MLQEPGPRAIARSTLIASVPVTILSEVLGLVWISKQGHEYRPWPDLKKTHKQFMQRTAYVK